MLIGEHGFVPHMNSNIADITGKPSTPPGCRHQLIATASDSENILHLIMSGNNESKVCPEEWQKRLFERAFQGAGSRTSDLPQHQHI